MTRSTANGIDVVGTSTTEDSPDVGGPDYLQSDAPVEFEPDQVMVLENGPGGENAELYVDQDTGLAVYAADDGTTVVGSYDDVAGQVKEMYTDDIEGGSFRGAAERAPDTHHMTRRDPSDGGEVLEADASSGWGAANGALERQ